MCQAYDIGIIGFARSRSSHEIGGTGEIAWLGMRARRRRCKCDVAAASATLTVRPMFPADNVWNVAIDQLPVDANSAAYITTIGPSKPVHPDFGTVYAGAPNGIPYTIVTRAQPRVPVSFAYAPESDPGPYPIPADAAIEGGAQSGGDRHVLIVDRDGGKLYELFAAYPNADGSWRAGSGAVFDLNSNALRPATWTSADAAGLPILPGLVRYEEVFAGEIPHALRFTAPQTRNAFIWPARHQASSLTGCQVSADGPALPAEAERRHQRLRPQRADHPARAEEVRHVSRGQRQQLVSSAERPIRAGTTTNCISSASCTAAISRPWTSRR